MIREHARYFNPGNFFITPVRPEFRMPSLILLCEITNWLLIDVIFKKGGMPYQIHIIFLTLYVLIHVIKHSFSRKYVLPIRIRGRISLSQYQFLIFLLSNALTLWHASLHRSHLPRNFLYDSRRRAPQHLPRLRYWVPVPFPPQK